MGVFAERMSQVNQMVKSLVNPFTRSVNTMTFATLTITFSHCIYLYCCWSVFKLELHQLSFPKNVLTDKKYYIYRLQTRFGARYCFYTCLSVHRVEVFVWCHSLSWCLVPCSFLGSLCLRPHVSSRGSLCKEGWGLCLGDLCPRGLWSRLCRGGGVLCQEYPRTVKSGRYASYWNAFFYLKMYFSESATICVRGQYITT